MVNALVNVPFVLSKVWLLGIVLLGTKTPLLGKEIPPSLLLSGLLLMSAEGLILVSGNANGGFDNEMQELQAEFTTEFLLQFLCRAVMPLATIDNPHTQMNDLADELILYSKDDKPTGEPLD